MAKHVCLRQEWIGRSAYRPCPALYDNQSSDECSGRQQYREVAQADSATGGVAAAFGEMGQSSG